MKLLKKILVLFIIIFSSDLSVFAPIKKDNNSSKKASSSPFISAKAALVVGVGLLLLITKPWNLLRANSPKNNDENLTKKKAFGLPILHLFEKKSEDEGNIQDSNVPSENGQSTNLPGKKGGDENNSQGSNARSETMQLSMTVYDENGNVKKVVNKTETRPEGGKILKTDEESVLSSVDIDQNVSTKPEKKVSALDTNSAPKKNMLFSYDFMPNEQWIGLSSAKKRSSMAVAYIKHCMKNNILDSQLKEDLDYFWLERDDLQIYSQKPNRLKSLFLKPKCLVENYSQLASFLKDKSVLDDQLKSNLLNLEFECCEGEPSEEESLAFLGLGDPVELTKKVLLKNELTTAVGIEVKKVLESVDNDSFVEKKNDLVNRLEKNIGSLQKKVRAADRLNKYIFGNEDASYENPYKKADIIAEMVDAKDNRSPARCVTT